MLNLHSPSPDRWLHQVSANLDELLIDHAHCEKKAAGVAMNLLFAYVEQVELCRAMTDIRAIRFHLAPLDRGAPLAPPGAATPADAGTAPNERIS